MRKSMEHLSFKADQSMAESRTAEQNAARKSLSHSVRRVSIVNNQISFADSLQSTGLTSSEVQQHRQSHDSRSDSELLMQKLEVIASKIRSSNRKTSEALGSSIQPENDPLIHFDRLQTFLYFKPYNNISIVLKRFRKKQALRLHREMQSQLQNNSRGYDIQQDSKLKIHLHNNKHKNKPEMKSGLIFITYYFQTKAKNGFVKNTKLDLILMNI